MIPETLEQCFEILDTFKDTEWINYPEENALAEAHHSIGQWIRNNWGLWIVGENTNKLKKWFIEKGVDHPDDISSIILTSYHRHKNNKDLKLEEQFNFYIDWWLSPKEKLLKYRKIKLKKLSEQTS